VAGIPPTHSLAFVGGDSVNFSFQLMYKDLDNPQNPPTPRNLTGYTAEAQIRTSPTSATIEDLWEIGTLGSDGIVSMHLTGAQTQPWTAVKSLISDVQLTDTAGDVETVLTITLQVSQDVTHV